MIKDIRNNYQIATLGGGCFWCLEAVYLQVKGVVQVESGYSGGNVPDPDYKSVCTGTTGHAEVVQITFDAETITYSEILQIFFSIHDPTTLNRQGNDVGTQYRSVIFYHDVEQQRTAEKIKSQLELDGIWDKPIVTQIEPIDKFYPAEDYHHNYFARNTYQPYCQVVITPKVTKFRKQFQNHLKA